MNTVCDIAVPIDVLSTVSGDVCIYPWFDLTGISRELDLAWDNYFHTRRKCCIPDNQDDLIREYISPFEIDQISETWSFSDVMASVQISGEFVYGQNERISVRDIDRRLKPFAIARHRLERALLRYFRPTV